LQCTVTVAFDDWEQMGLMDGFMDLVGQAGDLFRGTASQLGKLF
jgi:hypothetical protein